MGGFNCKRPDNVGYGFDGRDLLIAQLHHKPDCIGYAPHVPGDETTRLAGREAGVAIRMRGQPHVRGSSTDGRNPNLIPREHKDKALFS